MSSPDRSPLSPHNTSSNVPAAASPSSRPSLASVRHNRSFPPLTSQPKPSTDSAKSKGKSSGHGSAQQTSTRKSSKAKVQAPSAKATPTSQMIHDQVSSLSRKSSSTLSTGSVDTVKAVEPPTPSGAVRTPSYPFPRIRSSVSAAKPLPPQGKFGVQSPSWPPQHPILKGNARDRFNSIASTPGTIPPFFGASSVVLDDEMPGFPSPDLYKLVLELNSDTDFTYWWGVVCETLRKWYKADRVSLALPADPNDIENVPWGQKASYDISGLKGKSHNGQSPYRSNSGKSDFPHSNSPKTASQLDSQTTPTPRPALESSFSYASTDSEKLTYREGLSPRSSPPPGSSVSHGRYSRTSASDIAADQRSSPSNESDETSRIYNTLRPLDHEADELLDATSVNPILERGRIVTLSREYLDAAANSQDEKASGLGAQAGNTDKTDIHTSHTPSSQQKSGSNPSESVDKPARNRFSRKQTDPTKSKYVSIYEEYEQLPHSPWAQSPAPSPAIQAEPDENPFFTTGKLDEDTFATPTKEEQSDYSQVRAIGVDSGVTTIVHIPLVHPLLSRTMPSFFDEELDFDQDPGLAAWGAQTAHQNTERRAPIAILSMQAAAVPYPQNLLGSLRDLIPHLATSFHTSHLVTIRLAEALNRHSRVSTGTSVGLENLLRLGIDDSASSNGLASPSENSVRSASATSQSFESWGLGISTKNLPGGTPGLGVLEAADNYFDVNKRQALNRAHTTNVVSRNQLAQTSANAPINPRPQPPSRLTSTRRGDKNAISHLSQPKDALERRPSVLHSYGADFSASFPSLPVTAMPQTPGVNPSPGQGDMPPPSDRLLRTIIDSLPVQIFTAAPDTGSVTYVNSKFLVYRGQTPLHGAQTPRQVLAIHPDDLDNWMNSWTMSLRTGQENQQKVRLRRFDESYRWFYIKTAFLRDKHQKIVHVIGTCMDINEQHIAEINALRQQETADSEAKYRALANSSPQIVFAATRAKGVTFCNSQWLSYSGQSEEEAVGIGFFDHVHPDDIIKCKLPVVDASGATNVPISMPVPRRSRSTSVTPGSESSVESNATVTEISVSSPHDLPQRELSQLASAGIMKLSQDVAGNSSYSTEVRLRNKFGTYRWHLVRVILAEPILQEDDEKTWFGSCADINDHKELEQTLKETMDAKSRFLSNMSHEIRTPLNGIHGMSQFLIDSTNLTPEQMDQVNVIRASAEGLRDLINDILDLSKVEAGMITLNMDWLYVRSTIEEVNDLTSTLAMDKRIELNYSVENDVPMRVRGDRFRIRQVLLNVIGNAIKFTQYGEVFVCCKRAEHEQKLEKDALILQFDIVDTGRGFSEKEAERLFKRFSQIDGSSTRQHGGSGLGLVISMQLVELHGGTMTARSVPGKGSTFTFTIKVGTDPKSVVPKVSKPIKHDSVEDVRSKTREVTSPGIGSQITLSPAPMDSPSIRSSASSDPSIRSIYTGIRSERSSVSSIGITPAMNLALPSRSNTGGSDETQSSNAERLLDVGKTSIGIQPLLYSILVICPLLWARTAAVNHLDNALPKNIPHQITARDNLVQCQQMLGEEEITFSHIIPILPDADAVVALIDQVLQLRSLSKTSIIVVCDLAQKQEIVSHKYSPHFEQLVRERKVEFVFKPLKVSKLSAIFDPHKSRELSTDLNQSSAHQVAIVQKQVFDNMTRRLGNKGLRVLLVEDNKINQMVMLKLLKRTSIGVETVLDGKQCTDTFLAKPPDYYSIILCDLHMPVKDGYQTCRDIRKYEKEKGLREIPIIALSANVLGDVYEKCAAAGFSAYLTKPVQFKELSDLMTTFLDPVDPAQPLEFMKHRSGVVDSPS